MQVGKIYAIFHVLAYYNILPLLSKGLTGSSDKGQLRTDFILTKKAQGDER